MFAKVALAGGVDQGAIVDVGQVDIDLDDVLGRGAGGFQARVDTGQRAFRLLGHAVGDGTVVTDSDGAGDPDQVAGADDMAVVADRGVAGRGGLGVGWAWDTPIWESGSNGTENSIQTGDRIERRVP